jgi:hypothetical protein
VQITGLYGLTAADWKTLLTQAGLKAVSYQIQAIPAASVLDSFVADLETLGVTKVYYSNKGVGAQTYDTAASALPSVAKAKRALKASGITLGYRTTNKDFVQKRNLDGYEGQTMDWSAIDFSDPTWWLNPIPMITDPNMNATYTKTSAIDDVAAAGIPIDLDTFWTARSSRTVRDEIDKYKDSIDQISLQDLGITWNISYVSEELYEGHLNLDSIISAANAAGVESYVVTQEGGWYGNDPVASAKRSFDTLKAKGILVQSPVVPPEEEDGDNGDGNGDNGGNGDSGNGNGNDTGNGGTTPPPSDTGNGGTTPPPNNNGNGNTPAGDGGTNVTPPTNLLGTVPTPVVTGKSTVGGVLTVNPGAWPTGTKLTYQWYADGKAIKGATSKTFKVTKAVAGKKITVTVTGALNGVTKSSASPKSKAQTALNVFKKAPVPKITGTAKVGKKLTVKVGAWSPKATKFTYKWYRDGKVIKKATKKTYKLKKADKGHKITVKVTATKSKYVKTTKTSKKTKKVKGK